MVHPVRGKSTYLLLSLKTRFCYIKIPRTICVQKWSSPSRERSFYAFLVCGCNTTLFNPFAIHRYCITIANVDLQVMTFVVHFGKERWLKDLQSKILHFCNMSMNFCHRLSTFHSALFLCQRRNHDLRTFIISSTLKLL